MKIQLLSLFLLAGLSADAVVSIDNNMVIISLQEKQYKKVEVSQVPAEILKQASVKYSGYALNEVFVYENLEYKLVLSKNNKAVNAYYKSTGEFIKEEAKS
ncbi:hypothetical protein ACX0HA_04270 [Flavobacterium hauense]